MPKSKTHKGTAKRFKVTGSGKIVRQKANKQHILTKKTTKRKRGLRQEELISPADTPRVKKMIPADNSAHAANASSTPTPSAAAPSATREKEPGSGTTPKPVSVTVPPGASYNN